MAEALGTEPVMTAAEYAESVNQWLQQAYQWNVLAMGKDAKSQGCQTLNRISSSFQASLLIWPTRPVSKVKLIRHRNQVYLL